MRFELHVVFLSVLEHYFLNLLDPKNYLMCLLNISIFGPHRERPGNLYVYQELQVPHDWVSLGRNWLGSQIWLFLLITEKDFQHSVS